MSARGHDMDKEQFATNVYYDRTFDCDAAKILPGEYYYTQKDMLIVTVLGSCVSACIRDRNSGLGGMNHFMLPDGGSDAGSPVSASARYGTYAMEVLINDLLKAGARRDNLEAKVFGGGAVLKGFTAINVGERNAAFVQSFLKNEKIRVVAEDLCDIYPRKVYFFPKTGKVLVKKLMQTHNDTLAQRENDYANRLKAKPVAGEVELF
ncbi:chemoreceptor glutamine deamidase CheD [Pseudoduganella violaceinigra]|uniref:chemoreceptor glutamine deamidase CheD n=1 Tax=Pseudoduganella violaceinigra TaxID=246602 RepID=UPI001B7FD54E|nr:chemoreceptor glutamine deamidase CheD [Pseudoduganella violaceinigra]